MKFELDCLDRGVIPSKEVLLNWKYVTIIINCLLLLSIEYLSLQTKGG